MSVRTERPFVRTAQELERKYATLFNIETAVKQSEVGLVKVNNILNDFIAATIGDLETLQQQLDGQIDTWYGSGTPTLLNEPASNWQVSEYPDHIGDLYYDNSTGTTYQFEENNGTYSWIQIESSLMSEILSMANAAKDVADGKRRVFVTPYTINGTTYTTPQPPYEKGDLWLDDRELYVCQFQKNSGESYVSGDFIVATKYTDDTIALTAKQVAEQAEAKALNVEASHDRLQLNFDKRIILNDGSELATNPSTITFEDGAIVFAAGGSNQQLIRLRIDNDSIEFQDKNGNTFASWSAEAKSSNTTTLNLGDFQFKVRDDNGSLDFNHI